MDNFNSQVAYMENEDFDNNGNLINTNIPNGIYVVIMIQTSWCGHCNNAKPAFQEFANKYNKNKVFCATIQANGERDSEKDLGKRIKTIDPEFKGFPHYVLYKSGKRLDKKIKGRSVKDLENFANISA